MSAHGKLAAFYACIYWQLAVTLHVAWDVRLVLGCVALSFFSHSMHERDAEALR